MYEPPNTVLERYAWVPGRRCAFFGARGGFSGALLWRVADAAGTYALKAWPDDMTADRLTWIHELLDEAQAAGLAFAPAPITARDGTTAVNVDGRLWDLCTWQPGVADFRAQPSTARLDAACRALAELHGVWAGAHRSAGPCPGVLRRVDALRRWQALVASGWQPRWRDDDPVRTPAAEAWGLLPTLAPPALAALEPWTTVSLPLHPCWCDPWHDHLLFSGDALTGLIDHGSIKEDHAAVDLARLLGSLLDHDAPGRAVGIDAYRAVRPLTDDEAGLIAVLEHTGHVVAATHWLRWLYHEERLYADRPTIADRLARITRTLCHNH